MKSNLIDLLATSKNRKVLPLLLDGFLSRKVAGGIVGALHVLSKSLACFVVRLSSFFI